MTEKQIIKALKKRQEAVAKERDRLRDLQDEVEMLLDSVDRANKLLEAAIDALSELV
jgi:Mg2+ and Co2+ transporter CorA